MCLKQKYAPSVFEKYVTTISLGGKEIKLNLYDTAGKTLPKKKPTSSLNISDSVLSLYNDILHYVDIRVWIMLSLVTTNCVRWVVEYADKNYILIQSSVLM